VSVVPPNVQQIVTTAWRDQAIWSETANRLKAELTTWRVRAAIAGVVGALLETLAGVLSAMGQGWWAARAVVALAGAIILAVVPYVARTKASSQRVKEWVRARSASEALKEEIYRFLVGASPYGANRAPQDLLRRSRAVMESVQDLSSHAASVQPASRERPHDMTIDDYVERRINDQIERFYRPKGVENARAAERLHRWEFILGLAAVAMGAAASAATATGLTWLAVLGPWVAVITTAGAAVTAHLAAARYDHAAMSYFATANRLVSLRDEWLVDDQRLDPARKDKFVDDCETAISGENEAWMAEWTREK
jgi:hypothetical protein